MIRIFQLPQYAQIKTSSLYDLDDFHSLKKNIAWIDLQDPTQLQTKEIEEFYNINFPTRQQQEEIEISSRYLENSGIIKIECLSICITRTSRNNINRSDSAARYNNFCCCTFPSSNKWIWVSI